MAKYYGMVGYAEVMDDDGFGVYKPKIIERPYYGDLVRNQVQTNHGEGVNDDITIHNDISIIADAYAYQNFHRIRYVVFMGARWKVNSVQVDRPRLTLIVGGVYNGPTPDPSSGSEGDSGDQESVLPTP